MEGVTRFLVAIAVIVFMSSYAAAKESSSNELRRLVRHAREVDQCPPESCYMQCPYGKKLDDNGCEICECRTKEEVCGTGRCRNYCPNGYKEDERGCETCDCITSSRGFSSRRSSYWSSRRGSSSSNSRRRSGHKCGNVICAMHCEHGLQKDANGCDICACADVPAQLPASNRQSSSDDKTPVQLPAHTSIDTGRTIKTCSRVRCDKNCRYGYVKDRFGCNICVCRSRRQSLKESCEQRATCLNHCEHGYVKGPDGCNTCTCKEAPPSTSSPPVCPMCLKYCAYGMKPGPDGCPLCECNPPPTQ